MSTPCDSLNCFLYLRKISKNIGYADEELDRETITNHIEHVCDEDNKRGLQIGRSSKSHLKLRK